MITRSQTVELLNSGVNGAIKETLLDAFFKDLYKVSIADKEKGKMIVSFCNSNVQVTVSKESPLYAFIRDRVQEEKFNLYRTYLHKDYSV